MVSLASKLHSFNLFKHPIEFYFRQDQKQGHWSGILCSYVFTVFFLVVSGFFGLDFYTRTNPSINLVEANLEDFNSMKQKVANFPPFVYSLNQSVHHRVAAYFYEDGQFQKVARQCSEKELASFSFKQLDFMRYYCIDLHKIEMDASKLSSFYFIDCSQMHLIGKNSKEWGFNNCSPLTDEQTVFLNSHYMFYHSPKVKLEMNNYYNPIGTYYESHSQALKVRELRAMKLRMTFVRVKDDKGWIFKDESSTWGVKIDTNLEAILDFPYDTYYSRNQIDISGLVETHNRIYSKLQNLFAEVGGFLKVCMIIIRLPLIWISSENVKVNCIKDFLSNDKKSSFLNEFALEEAKESTDSQKGLKAGNQVKKENCALSRAKIQKLDSVTEKKPKRRMLLKLLSWNRFCCRPKVMSQESKLVSLAERLTKDILSVEQVFKTYFELDIIKRILLGEEGAKVIRAIQNPNIFNSKDILTPQYIELGSPVNEQETNAQIEKLKEKLNSGEKLSKFEKIIVEYL